MTEQQSKKRRNDTNGQPRGAGTDKPQNRNAERAVLGCMIRDNAIAIDIARRVQPEHFYVWGHQCIFKGLVDLVAQNQPADIITLSHWLTEAGLLEDAGGHHYVTSLWDAAPNPTSAGHYADILQKEFVKRRLIETCNEVADAAYDRGADVTELLLKAEQSIAALNFGGDVNEPPYRFEGIDIVDLLAQDHRPEWLVKGVSVRGQSGVLGGPRKTLKTTFLLDLAVSLATATPFLGKFVVPRAVKVAIISGESGRFVITEVVNRILAARRGITEFPRDKLHLGFRMPKLTRMADLRALQVWLRDNGAEFCAIDPIYLCLLAGVNEEGPQASNLFQMGPVYQAVSEACLSIGCTPYLAHHFNRAGSVADIGQPDLSHLSFAGISEFAAQWLLLNRREAFRPGSGEHKLWLVAGGRVGHSGTWGLNINEGTMGDDFGGRVWDVQVLTEAEAIMDKEAFQDERRDDLKRFKERANGTKLLVALDELDPDRQGVTKNRLREHLKWAGKKLKDAADQLIEDGLLEAKQVTIQSGKGGNRAYEGYVRIDLGAEKESDTWTVGPIDRIDRTD